MPFDTGSLLVGATSNHKRDDRQERFTRALGQPETWVDNFRGATVSVTKVGDVAGMLVAGAPGLRRAPSEHFAVSLSAVSPLFRQMVADLIDGRGVAPDGQRLDVSARKGARIMRS